MTSSSTVKLIRDRIPEIMDRDGVRYEVEVLDDGAYREALLAKVGEDAEELRAAVWREDVVKELADVLEVLAAVLRVAGSTPRRCGRCRPRGGRRVGGSSGGWRCGGRRGEGAAQDAALSLGGAVDERA